MKASCIACGWLVLALVMISCGGEDKADQTNPAPQAEAVSQAGATPDDVLKIDFGTPGQDVAEGFVGLGVIERPQSITFDQGNGLPPGVSLKIETIDPEDRVDFMIQLPGALSGDLAFPDDNEGGLRVTLTGQTPGSYRLTSYHNHDLKRADFDVYINGVLENAGQTQSQKAGEAFCARAHTDFQLDGETAVALGRHEFHIFLEG